MKRIGSRNKDYVVGYKRPPKHSRWKKGHTGNPKGRRKKANEGLAECFERVFGEALRVRQGDKVHKVSTAEAMFRKLKSRILAGDAKAFTSYLDLAKKLGMLDAVQRQSFVEIKFLE